MEMSETPKFSVGDRAVVNDQFDPRVPNREALVGAEGTISYVVPDSPELLYFVPDNSSLAGLGLGGSWAVIDFELDKLEF